MHKRKNEFVYLPQPNKSIDTNDYMNLCDELKTIIGNNSEANKIIDTIKCKFNTIRKIGINYHRKTNFICSFMSYVKNTFNINIKLSDKTTRKYIENTHNMNTIFGENLYGNPKFMEIIFVCEYCELIDFIKCMDNLYRNSIMTKNKRLCFGTYRLDYVYNLILENNDEGEYSIILTDTDNISIKCKIIYTHNYLQNFIINNMDHPNAYQHIAEKKVETIFNLAKYIRQLNGIIDVMKRKKILLKVCDVLTEGIYYMHQGYDHFLIGDNSTIHYTIEDNDDCPITFNSPPYINIHLECKHLLSVPALYGMIVQNTSEHNTMICPQCRKNIIPKILLVNIITKLYEVKTKNHTFTMETKMEHQYTIINNSFTKYKNELKQTDKNDTEWDDYFNEYSPPTVLNPDTIAIIY